MLERQLAIHQQYADEQTKLKPTPPTTTLSSDMTLHRGSREIQIRFLGRAHTDGDVVVFLPRERIVATGDMITARCHTPEMPLSRNGLRRSSR